MLTTFRLVFCCVVWDIVDIRDLVVSSHSYTYNALQLLTAWTIVYGTSFITNIAVDDIVKFWSFASVIKCVIKL